MAHATEAPREGTGLRRGSLTIWEAIGLSIALMAPSMAANINPQGTVGLVGRAVPLAFVFATVGVLLISYTFVRLCEVYHHAGSVFGFVGATLGPRAGVLAGWSLMGTYTFYACVTSAAAGIFSTTFLDEIGIWDNHPAWSEFLFAFIALGGAFMLASFPARRAARILLSIEGATVALIIIVATIVLIKVISGDTPGNQEFTLKVFQPASGTTIGDIFKGAVFGFLSFAGFEAASTLGEETKEPRRAIPLAIVGTAVFGGIYFVYVTSVEMMGFGVDDKGVLAFASSGSLLGDLGSTYIASWIGDLITLGTAISAFGCTLACVVGATRILYALSRDGVGTTALDSVHGETGTPVRALAVVTIAAAVIILIDRIFFTTTAFDVFFWSGVIGTLILLFAYLMATVGCIRLLWFRGTHRVPIWQIVVPIAAMLVLLATLYYNIDPDATTELKWNYITAAGWVIAGAVLVLVLPGIATRVGQSLSQHEGLTESTAGE